MTRPLNRSEAKNNPQANFASPMDIVNERKLTRGEKVATLDRWRQSVLERIGTAEHGTRTCKHAPGQAQTLNLIEQAKQLLTRADLRPPVPTER